MYASLRKSKDLGLITSRSDSRSYPPRNMISLTDKGKKVAKHLKEIEEILEER
jgi:DNA-binding PadR family transcriptional regulator